MDLLSLLPFVLIIAVFYFLIIRPSQKRRRDQAALLNAVKPGDRIMTTAGMLGTVSSVDGDEFTLEVSPGVELRFIKGAIGRVIPPPDAEQDLPSTPEGKPSEGSS